MGYIRRNKNTFKHFSLIFSLSLSLSLPLWRPGPLEVTTFFFSFHILTNKSLNIWYQSSDLELGIMIEIRSNSQNSEKIAALSKITDSHEQTLQEVKKQL